MVEYDRSALRMTRDRQGGEHDFTHCSSGSQALANAASAICRRSALVLRCWRRTRSPTRPTQDARSSAEVSIRGVKGVDINQLREGLVTKGTACKSVLYLPLCWVTRSPLFTNRYHLDPLEFRRDVLRIRIFYWQRGWRDVAVAQAKTERTANGVRAIFEIDEREPTVISDLRVVQSDSVLATARYRPRDEAQGG